MAPSPYDYASSSGYARARADWIRYGAPGQTLIRADEDLDRWDQAIYDLKRQAINPLDYGAKFDGVTDDASALTAAAADALAFGAPLWLPPKATAIIGSQLTFGAITVLGNGATLKRKPAVNATMLLVNGACRLRELTLDGNRANGGAGIGVRWTANGGDARAVVSSHHTTAGWHVDGGSVRLYECEGSDNVTGDGHGYGLRALNAGWFETRNFTADDNDQNGFELSSNAADGIVVHGRARRNKSKGANIQSQAGQIPYLFAEDNRDFGVFLTAADRWTLFVVVKDTGRNVSGQWTANSSGSSVELAGCSRCRGIVWSINPRGYGLAIARQLAGSGVASSANHFELDADATEATDVDGDSDPALHMSGGAQHNNVFVRTRKHSIGARIGELSTGTDYPSYDNNDNVIVIEAEATVNAPVVIEAGCRNSVRVKSRDCTTQDGVRTGIVDIATNFSNFTGSITTGTNQLTVSGFAPRVGMGVKVTGAGPAAADLTSVVDAVVGSVCTLRDNAGTTVVGAVCVQVPLTATGAATNGSKTLTISSAAGADGFTVGIPVKVAGAGVAAADLYTTIDMIAGTTFTLHDAASTTQPAAAVTQLFTFRNVVEFVDHASGPGKTKPKYIVHMDANGAQNVVLDGVHRGDYQTAESSLAGSGNAVNPTLPATGSLRV